MTIETKYNIGDEVWFMCENKAQNGEVTRVKVEVYEHYYSTHPIPFIVEPTSIEKVERQKVCYEVRYGTQRKSAELDQKILLPTKEELLKSL